MADPAQVKNVGNGEGADGKATESLPLDTKPVEAKPVEEVKVEKVQPESPEVKIDAATTVQQNSTTDDKTKTDDNMSKEPEANSKTVETQPKDDVNKGDNVPKESIAKADACVKNAGDSSEPSTEVKTEINPEQTVNATPKEEANETKESGDWQQREQELLKKIEELEKVKNERSEDGLKLQLKVREEEIDLLKARVKNLETELQAALSKPGGKNQEMIEKIKLQHEELLSKARGMIFDKTKMVKNQELQIEALTTQVQSLKDINQITKDLLEIRNSEVKAMEERLQVMEARFKAEKERYDLVLKRAATSNNINDDLRKEYETQLALFKELREKYELRVQALVAENNRLKESTTDTAGTSG